MDLCFGLRQQRYNYSFGQKGFSFCNFFSQQISINLQDASFQYARQFTTNNNHLGFLFSSFIKFYLRVQWLVPVSPILPYCYHKRLKKGVFKRQEGCNSRQSSSCEFQLKFKWCCRHLIGLLEPYRRGFCFEILTIHRIYCIHTAGIGGSSNQPLCHGEVSLVSLYLFLLVLECSTAMGCLQDGNYPIWCKLLSRPQHQNGQDLLALIIMMANILLEEEFAAQKN